MSTLQYLSNGVKLRENKVRNGLRDFWNAILNRFVWEDLTDDIVCDQKPEETTKRVAFQKAIAIIWFRDDGGLDKSKESVDSENIFEREK